MSASAAFAAPPNAAGCTTPPAGVTLVVGTEGNDTLNGTPGPDFICGLGGNDSINAGVGDDTIDGGLGADSIVGGRGTNTVTYAGRTAAVGVTIGAQVSFGGEGCDVFLETCSGGENDSYSEIQNITGGSGSDSLIGDQAGSTLNGGPAGDDTLCGGLGDDTVDYSDRTAPVNVSLDGVLAPFPGTPPGEVGLPVRQTCLGVTGSPQEGQKDCVANDGQAGEHDCVGRDVETVIGGSGNDTLTGDDPSPFVPDPNAIVTGENVLEGGPGDDSLDGRAAPDVLFGGSGNDTVTYADRTEPVTASIDEAANDGGLTDLNPVNLRRDTIQPDVENIIGGSGNDTLKGDGDPNSITGGGGSDSIDGGGGNDSLDGGAGNDAIGGAGGNDTISGGSGNDVLDGGSGVDSVQGNGDDDSLAGGSGADSLVGGDGTDVADYSSALTSVSVNPNGVADDGAAGEGDNVAGDVEGAKGGIDDDVLIGNAGNGTLSGGAGEDVLDGGAGADTLIGGAGFDTATYVGRSATVKVTLDGAANDGQAGENDNAQVEKVIGGSGKDTLGGDVSANVLDGGPGDDTLSGGGGADVLHGDAGNDTVNGNDGRDILNGDDGGDTLKGGSGNDSLLGGAGKDSLDGGTGADSLGGGTGEDTANYAERVRKVNVRTADGSPIDGEVKEGDTVKSDVESVKTGSGNDKINAKDGVAGHVSCGRGRERATVDSVDKVSSDCELTTRVSSLGSCTVLKRSVRMSRRGVVRLGIRCPARARGTLSLRASKRVVKSSTDATSAKKRQRKATKVTIGRKSFSIRAGKTKTLEVKLSRKGRRAVLHSKRLRVDAVVALRGQKGAARPARSKAVRKITIKAPRRHR